MSKEKWHDITSEEWREYDFGVEGIVYIEKPVKLNIKRRADGLDSHRVLDSDGISHYIRPGWLEVKWKSKIDAPPFLNITAENAEDV